MSPLSCPKHASARSARDSGFTLIELIAVIIVLGILAAVIVPRYTGFADNALLAAAKTATGEGATRLKGASQLYAVDTNQPPQALADISNSTYLDLTAGNTLNIGNFVVKYVAVSGTPPKMEIQALDATGTTVLYTLTVEWPN
ncbi:MAG: prepilin-type N-terminal cleavage/methylation domain-containing protein [Humidesulfovibrio sp.]|nr:prepilin-type N-terminal cleavage/methylation domain-containing protein [Humidesulfovibrio sp.]